MSAAAEFASIPAARARRGPRKTAICAHCGMTFSCKASKNPVCCSVACHADHRRTRPRATARPCEICGNIFKPARHRGDAKYCSRSCVWKATRGPEHNAKIAREHNAERNRAARGTGTKGYVKRDGRHEHRVVAEQILGRPLRSDEVVHHIDEDKHNNDPSNLKVMTQAEHMREHGLGIPGAPLAHEPWKYTAKYRGRR